MIRRKEIAIRKVFTITLFLFLSIIFYSCQTAPPSITPPTDPDNALLTPIENEHILYGFPSIDCQILYRSGYVLCQDVITKTADWASYHLTDKYLVSMVNRTDDFRADPELPLGKRAELLDYRESGYDRGHLVPAADMARNLQSMSESFLLSNMAPQIPSFNRGIWKVLEDKVRTLTKDKKELYIITGTLFLDSSVQRTVGLNKVGVPSHFYKILITGIRERPASLEAVAFIIPNAFFPSDQLKSFIVTIDKVEEKSGLDFLNELDDNLENSLEAENKLARWFLN